MRKYIMSLLSCPRERRLLRDIPADAGDLYDKTAVFGDMIKGTSCTLCSNSLTLLLVIYRPSQNTRYVIAGLTWGSARY
jgi:hypothetical protein